MNASALSPPLAAHDTKGWLVAPALLFIVALFIYPFAYGLVLSFQPMNGGGVWANYVAFFTDTSMWPTILVTLKLAVPATLINVGVSIPVAFALRRNSPYQKLVTTLLVIPVTLGTVLIADGMLTYFGPNGWFPQALQGLHLYTDEVRLTHNYWGVLISLIVSGFPFAFLLTLSYVTGIDPTLASAAATLGASSSGAFICRCWSPV
jgi:putative spermidine/putrescine transport system permease protein